MLPRFNPIWNLVQNKLKATIAEAEAEFKARREEIRAKHEKEEEDAAHEIVARIFEK